MSEYIPTTEIQPNEPVEKHLQPHELVTLNLDTPLARADEMQQKLGVKGNLVASVEAGGMDFLIVDTRNFQANRDFLILDDAHHDKGLRGVKGINENEIVTLGRNYHRDRFQYPKTVSAEHFQVLYRNNSLHIQNLEPTNETIVTGHFVTEPALYQPETYSDISSYRTVQAWDRVKNHSAFDKESATAPYGFFMNHPIIGRLSPSVNEGVYLGGTAREAIVVDGTSEIMENTYAALRFAIKPSPEKGYTTTVEELLSTVMRITGRALPYDERRVEQITDQAWGDQLIGLSTFIDERAGVCRHQSLLSAYLIERLIKDSILSGEVHVERNSIEGKGSHGWATYTPGDGRPAIVIDATQGFLGTKAKAQQEGRWNYNLGRE